MEEQGYHCLQLPVVARLLHDDRRRASVSTTKHTTSRSLRCLFLVSFVEM